MAEILRKQKSTGRIGVFDDQTKEFLRWQDETSQAPSISQDVSSEKVSGITGNLGAGLVSALQSGTFGLSDELIGALETPGRAFEKAQPGESFLDKIGRIYKEQRDLERANIKRAEEEAPIASTIGSLGGAFAMPGAWLAKGGLAATKALPAIAETAPNLVKALQSPLGRMTTGGAEAGALMGLGTSEKEDLGGMLSDTYSGAKSGALFGGGLGIAGKLLSKIPGIFPRVSSSLEKGQKGIKITSPEYEKNVIEKAQKEAQELTDVITGKQQILQETIEEGEKKAFQTLEKTRNSVNNKLDDIQKNTSDYLENQKQLQQTTNERLQQKLQKDLEQKSLQLQKDIDDVRVGLGKEYDAIDDMAEKAGVQVDTTPVINNIIDELGTTGLTESAINAIAKKLEPEFGKVDFKSFQSLKRKLQDLFEHPDPMVRSVAKKSYGKMTEAFEKTLRANKLDDLANKIQHTNRRWSIYANMDDFVTGTRIQKPFDERFATPKTIQTVERIGLPEAESISMKKQLEARLPEIMPQTAQTRIDEMTKLSQEIAAAKAAKAEVPTIGEALSQDVEYQRLQKMLDELKGTKVRSLDKLAPETQKVRDIIKDIHGEEAADQFMNALSQMEFKEQKSFINQFGTTPESIKRKLLSTIPKGEQKFEPGRQEELETLLKIYKEKFGEEKTKEMAKKLTETAKDIELGKLATGPIFGGETLTKPGIARGLLGSASSVAVKGANLLGLTEHQLLNSPPGILLKKANETKDNFLKDYFQKLASRDKTGRQALLFTLMQNPAYREYIQSEPEEK